jgi:hypothetical protein
MQAGRREWEMKFLGDIKILGKEEKQAKPVPAPRESGSAHKAPTPQLVEEVTPPSGSSNSHGEAGAGTEHYAAAVRYYLKGQLDKALDELIRARDAC